MRLRGAAWGPVALGLICALSLAACSSPRPQTIQNRPHYVPDHAALESADAVALARVKQEFPSDTTMHVKGHEWRWAKGYRYSMAVFLADDERGFWGYTVARNSASEPWRIVSEGNG